ncbi:MAG: OmpA family protein [Segetibacter sp.]|nr:OmpA family protein [Segetibacter sp.]
MTALRLINNSEIFRILILVKCKNVVISAAFFITAVLITTGLFSQTSFQAKTDGFSLYTNSTCVITSNSINHNHIISGKITPRLFSVTSILSFKDYSLIKDTIRKGSNDRDKDGIVDSLDKCPDEKGVIEYDGCPMPDSDNDGVADDVDQCPAVRGLAKYKGCPPPDKDGDKIADDEDKCPDQPGVARYDGCLPGDRDKDGVNDDDDKCIDIAGKAKNAGCPQTKAGNILSGKSKRK